jgi:hypothetical protein
MTQRLSSIIMASKASKASKAPKAPTWDEIRDAAEHADLDMALWEEELHNRLVDYLLTHTKSVQRYQTDAVFHAEIERLVGLVVGCLIEHSPLYDPLLRTRAADFDKIFQQGAQEGRPFA